MVNQRLDNDAEVLRKKQAAEQQKKQELLSRNQKAQEFLSERMVEMAPMNQQQLANEMNGQHMIGAFAAKFNPMAAAKDLESWNNATNMSGKDMADHPLMQNPTVSSFARGFAEKMLSLDENSGRTLTRLSFEETGVLTEFNAAMGGEGKNAGLMKKIGVAAGLASGGDFGAELGGLAAKAVFVAAKNILNVTRENILVDSPDKKNRSSFQKMMDMKPEPRSK